MDDATLKEMFNTMHQAAQQDARGERPSIVPDNAIKVDGVWRWEDEEFAWWWSAGEPVVHAWSKTVHVSSQLEGYNDLI